MKQNRAEALLARRRRIRSKVRGTPDRPRLCLHKSSRHLYAQLVNDREGRTLAFATTNVKANKSLARSFCNVNWAKKLGEDLARKTLAQGVSLVVFDRGGNRYHGVVKAFADAAREAGLKF